MQDQILDMLLKKDEISWQSILYELIKTEQMNPWDIDVSILSQKYMNIVKQLQETNFSVSGKVILAAAILLKIKSDKLLTEDISRLDLQLFPQEEMEELGEFEPIKQVRKPRLTIKTPQTRKKKVSVQDLVNALERALEVEKRRKIRRETTLVHPEVLIPEKKVDISQKIKEIYVKISGFFKVKKEKLTFTTLVNSDKKEDKLMIFVPLLHLENQQKINMFQERPFEEIEIELEK